MNSTITRTFGFMVTSDSSDLIVYSNRNGERTNVDGTEHLRRNLPLERAVTGFGTPRSPEKARAKAMQPFRPVGLVF